MLMATLLVVVLADFSFQSDHEYLSPFNLTGTSYEDFETRLLILESQYCRTLCGFELDYPTRLEPNDNCDQCMCDEKCSLYADCCPDVKASYVSELESRCIGDSIKGQFPDMSSYRMIASCPVDWLDDDVRRMCTRLCEEGDIACYIPVTDSRIGITYRNRYCSKCNAADDIVAWETSANCVNNNIFSKAMSSTELFKLVLATHGCDIAFTPRDLRSEVLRYCIPSMENRISVCNVTGLWIEYDADIERACSLYRREVMRVYRNMFCRLCNGASWLDMKYERSYAADPKFVSVPLTALLQFGNTADTATMSEGNDIDSKCNQSQVYDKSMSVCRDVRCVEGKYLSGNECRSYFPRTNFLGYRLCYNVSTVMESRGEDLHRSLRGLLKKVTKVQLPVIDYDLVFTEWFTQCVGMDVCGHSLQVTIQTQFSLISTTARDQTHIQNYILGIVPQITKSLEDSIGVKAAFTGSCGKAMESDAVLIDNITVNSSRVKGSFQVGMDLIELVQNAHYVAINRFMVCPHVMLEGDGFEILNASEKPDLDCTSVSGSSRPPVDFVLFKWRASNKTIPADRCRVTSRGVVVMCVEDFLELTDVPDENASRRDRLPTATPLGILSVVCTGVSLVFLVITFIVYSLFRELRTTGGVCNMGLVVNMSLAQVLYEFGMEQNENPVLCSIIGALIHFFWLTVILWMNVCVVQFFLKLCFPIKSLIIAAGTRNTFVIACVYSYGISFLAVGITILTHELILGDVGYGGNICYFSTQTGQIFAFVLPVGLITVSNIVMFTVTVVQLRRRILTSSGKDHRIGLLACVKLSSLTGLAWIFAYLYTASSVTALAYVFTVLVGGQGFFLFLALMVNGRVLQLVRCRRGTRNKYMASHSCSHTADTRLQ